MLESISSLLNNPETNTVAEKKTDELGKDSFLTMFMAQIKYQDPLNPMDGKDFSAQLAQFSSLEQLYSVNDNLEALKTSQDNNGRFQALDFIGKEIVAEGNTLSLALGQTAEGGFTLGTGAFCSAMIYDQNGFPIRVMALGALESGAHNFVWDGLDNSGNQAPPGAYGFEITATNGQGEILPVQTRVVGQVTRINLEGGSPILYVGELAVDLSQVLDIKVPDIKVPDGA